MSKIKLSVVVTTRNEQDNIGECLRSVKKVADEIVVVDEESTDKTPKIAKKNGARVVTVKHKDIFHINKQRALEEAKGEWILQLDADERVTPALSSEIKRTIYLTNDELEKREIPKNKLRLFNKHQSLIEKRDGTVGKSEGPIVAFFIPRLNYFLGAPLRHAGVYPDGVIRLVKKGKAYFPAKSVHEVMQVDGKVAWLENDVIHHDSPPVKRYLERANRYTDLTAIELDEKGVPANILYLALYTIYKPLYTFLNLYFRHKGFLDGMRGFVWSLFSALHFPLAYFKYWQRVHE